MAAPTTPAEGSTEQHMARRSRIGSAGGQVAASVDSEPFGSVRRYSWEAVSLTLARQSVLSRRPVVAAVVVGKALLPGETEYGFRDFVTGI